MLLALCNEMFENQPFEHVCDVAKALGYHALEVSPFTLAPRAEQVSAAERLRLRKVAESRGMHILGLHWLLAKVQVDPPGFYTTHPDAAVRRATAAYFVELTKLCADLGGSIMVIGSPKQRDLMPGVSREQAMGYAAEVFRPCLDIAAQRNVMLAIEPLGPAETNFLNTAADGIELIERIAHPNFRLHLDVKAMSSESTPIPDILRASRRHLRHFHANDPNLLGPGMGAVKFEPIIAALREVDYPGYLSVEVFDFKPGAENIARQSVEYLKRVLG